MQTVDKAVELLGYFSQGQPEWGLSELARATGFDKASTRRLLLALMKHDYIEQNKISKAYRLGPGVIRLARIRESTTPLIAIIQPLLDELVAQTEETAHFALLASDTMSTVSISESPRSNRICFVLGEEAPLHATASGIVTLAYAGEPVAERFIRAGLDRFTKHTVSDAKQFRALLSSVRELGYFINQEMYEPGVSSIAAPVFSSDPSPLGAIAVAAPSSRFDRETQETIRAAVVKAAARASVGLGADRRRDDASRR